MSDTDRLYEAICTTDSESDKDSNDMSLGSMISVTMPALKNNQKEEEGNLQQKVRERHTDFHEKCERSITQTLLSNVNEKYNGKRANAINATGGRNTTYSNKTIRLPVAHLDIYENRNTHVKEILLPGIHQNDKSSMPPNSEKSTIQHNMKTLN